MFAKHNPVRLWNLFVIDRNIPSRWWGNITKDKQYRTFFYFALYSSGVMPSCFLKNFP